MSSQRRFNLSGVLQVTGETLAGAEGTLGEMPGWQKRTGTYVGCMFVDYMTLLQRSYGFPSTGAVMTGAVKTPN